ncbi:hypothetical protein [Ralstonia sp. ASV6]|uniref:hypothetical protein n=1 Tax=Ralstonia sp. ASV6 TaxID=2795124 RepID=UPI0018ECACFC|nr:hypothetical protein [Ralstonia sp. ASV6]
MSALVVMGVQPEVAKLALGNTALRSNLLNDRIDAVQTAAKLLSEPLEVFRG